MTTHHACLYTYIYRTGPTNDDASWTQGLNRKMSDAVADRNTFLIIRLTDSLLSGIATHSAFAKRKASQFAGEVGIENGHGTSPSVSIVTSNSASASNGERKNISTQARLEAE
jgi:hypothetical protein